MPDSPTYSALLSAATLGTARRELPRQVTEWVESTEATDPTADEAEQLLAAIALRERANRLQLIVPSSKPTPPPAAPPETRLAPSPKLARGLELILEGPYPMLLDEGIDLVLQRNTYLPPALLPALLPRTVDLLGKHPLQALSYLDAGGERGRWLARLHPEWEILGPDFDFDRAFQVTTLPSLKATLLKWWRLQDPEAGRLALEKNWAKWSARNQELIVKELRYGLGPEDREWLTWQSTTSRRKGVKRAIAHLLLLLTPPEALPDRIRGGSATWRQLSAPELVEVRDFLVDYPDEALAAELLQFLLYGNRVGKQAVSADRLAARLSPAAFTTVYHQLLTDREDALRPDGLAFSTALSRTTPWSERLSKAMMHQFLAILQRRRLDHLTQRRMAEQWRRAIPLLAVALFPWLRQQLGTTLERLDLFGKLATETLQIASFRWQLRE